MPETVDTTLPEIEQIVVRAFDYASAYDLRAARELLTREPGGKVLGQNPLAIQVAPQTILVVFEYGSVVFFNYAADDCALLLERLKSCCQRPNRSVSTDEFVLNVAGRGKRPEGTDELTVKEFNRDTAILVAVVLSRSVALEYYEIQVSSSLEQLEQTVADLATVGKIRGGERSLTRQVGFALQIEHQLAYELDAFDDPDIVWDGGKRIEQLYKDLKREFDLDDRVRIIQQKVSIISRWSQFVISRLEGHRANLLEWIIIILILSEIVLILFGKM
jgi:uncharacterized Rmd1/YagE family protein